MKLLKLFCLKEKTLCIFHWNLKKKMRRRALTDTGACANAMPADFYKKLIEESPNSISELQHAPFLNVKVASGRTVKVLAQVDVKFKVNDPNFQDTFLILPSMNSVVLGNPFFKKYINEISPDENLLKLPEMTYQLTEIRIPKEGRRKNPKSRNPVFMYQKNICQAPKSRNSLHKNRIFKKSGNTHRNDNPTPVTI